MVSTLTVPAGTFLWSLLVLQVFSRLSIFLSQYKNMHHGVTGKLSLAVLEGVSLCGYTLQHRYNRKFKFYSFFCIRDKFINFSLTAREYLNVLNVRTFLPVE